MVTALPRARRRLILKHLVEPTKKQKKQFRMQVARSLSSLADLFTPYFLLIKAKQGDEEYQAKAVQAFTKWVNGDNPDNLKQLCREGFALEDKLQEAARVQRAFAAQLLEVCLLYTSPSPRDRG